MKLTGRYRLRPEKRFLRPLVLVLEVEETGYQTDYNSGYIDSREVTRWRDARIEDFSGAPGFWRAAGE